MSCGIIIPTLGSALLEPCLAAVAALDPAPDLVLVVHSGTGTSRIAAHGAGIQVLRQPRRLGFAAAINTGIQALPAEVEHVAVLNDDTEPAPAWLAPLRQALVGDDHLAAVQGTVSDARGELIDGRGISLDRWGLAVQVDRGQKVEAEPVGQQRSLLGVSGTAALLRRQALAEVCLQDGDILDSSFGSYYEDLDLALRLHRLGWQAAWVAGAACRHHGSFTGSRLSWRHPWWLLANRWRALAGNLTGVGLLGTLPRLLRGELRAQRTLLRDNRRLPVVALAVTLCLPVLVARGLHRSSPGHRLAGLDLPGLDIRARRCEDGEP